MTDTRFVPVDELVREEAREPPRRWRNKWFLEAGEISTDELSREIYFGPRVLWSRRIWPSKETAEARARELIERGLAKGLKLGGQRWLGAFPVEDT